MIIKQVTLYVDNDIIDGIEEMQDLGGNGKHRGKTMNERAEKILEQNPFLNNMELAYRLIFEDIIMGKYKYGERLQQDKLSILYGMSRTPIRDALIKLETEGYVIKDERAGYKVSEVDVLDYIEFWEFRRHIESKVAALAAFNISDAQMREIRRNLEKTRELGNHGSFQEVFECDEEFHNLVVTSCGNKYFIGIYDFYQAKIRYYRYLFQKQAASASLIYSGHYKIYKALEKRDEDAARRAMYQHMNVFMEHLRQKLKYDKERSYLAGKEKI